MGTDGDPVRILTENDSFFRDGRRLERMDPTSEGRYRVLAVDGGDLLLVDASPDPETADVDAYDPIAARLSADEGGSTGPVPDLEPGNLVRATLAWPDEGPAEVAGYEVERRTRIRVGDGVEGMFEVAEETWRDARASGESMASRVTRDTDGEVNGVLYVFADGGGRDTLEALRTGAMPLEPLLQRVDESGDGAGDDGTDDGNLDEKEAADRAVFLLRPAGGEYVAVVIALERDGLLARTIRDTYDVS